MSYRIYPLPCHTAFTQVATVSYSPDGPDASKGLTKVKGGALAQQVSVEG